MPHGELTFRRSEEVAEVTASVFAAHELRIRERLPDVEIRHHGGTSLPGLLTSGDVDLHVRTDERSFRAARDVLCRLYEPMFRGEWDSQVAYFFASGSRPAVEVVLTAIGSLGDLHHFDAWRRIAADGRLIESYNALKLEHEGGSIDDYKRAKREFFRELVRSLPGGGDSSVAS